MIDLTGKWDGTFAYPAGRGPVTPFLADLRQRGHSLTGFIIEPDIYGGASPAQATLTGVAGGQSVDFTKVYRGARVGYVNPVDYVGQVLDDGDRIAGMWSLRGLNGAFEMIRHATRREAAQRETEETINARS